MKIQFVERWHQLFLRVHNRWECTGWIVGSHLVETAWHIDLENAIKLRLRKAVALG